MYSSKSDSYVISSRGVSNFRAVSEIGKVLSGLGGGKFDITFLQDRDGMPDFIVDLFTSSQNNEGVNAFLLERHEIENYLLEPNLIVEAVKNCGGSISARKVSEIILDVAQEIKAEARRACMKCAELVNRHLKSEKIKDKDLDIEVYRWFDGLDLSKLETIQKVFPGKELLPKVVEALNKQLSVKLTRGNIVSAINESLVAKDIVGFLKGDSPQIASAKKRKKKKSRRRIRTRR